LPTHSRWHALRNLYSETRIAADAISLSISPTTEQRNLQERQMKPDTSTLKDLVEVLNDGKIFYEEAAAKVNRPELRDLFRRMAGTKAAIVSDLQSKIVQRGADAPGADTKSVAGTLLKAWGELRASMSSAPNVEYVSQLEDFEDRIVAAFKDAAEKSEDADVRSIAARHMPQVLRDHSEMRALKLEFKRAS